MNIERIKNGSVYYYDHHRYRSSGAWWPMGKAFLRLLLPRVWIQNATIRNKKADMQTSAFLFLSIPLLKTNPLEGLQSDKQT